MQITDFRASVQNHKFKNKINFGTEREKQLKQKIEAAREEQ